MAYQPKSYKKFVATAATATLVATAIAPTALAASFTDVSSNYKVAVDYLVEKGITEGISDTKFGTDAPIKRGDAAIFIAKALKLDTVNAPNQDFTDVNSRVAGAVNAIVNAKIASGKTESTFAPDDYITRQEMAKILVNAYDLKAGDTKNSFTDVNNTWDGFVDALLANGVTLGLTETTFGATSNVTRGQFALFIHRAEVPAGLTVKSVVATDAKTLTVTLSDNTTHEVKLPTALEAGKETEVTFKINDKEYKAKVTYIAVDPVVLSISASNAKELNIVFNKAIDEDSVITAADTLVAGVLKLNSNDASGLVSNAFLSEDGKTLTLVAATTWSGSYAAEVVKDKVETKSGEKVAEYKAFVSVNDTTRPTFNGVSYEPSGLAKFTFSEPLNEDNASIASKLVVSGSTSVTINAADITVAANKKSFTVALPASMTKDASYSFTFTGLKDYANNLVSPNPVSATVVKADRDTVKPTVTNVAALDTGKLQVTFSEKIKANTATVTVGGQTYSTYTLDTTGTIATFTGVSGLTAGVHSVTVKAAQDLAGLVLDDVTRVVQVSADTTAPAYVNHTVETSGADRFLVVNYNEEVTANQGVTVTGTYVNSNNITLPMTGITGASISTGADKKSVRIKLPATAGTYTVTLPAGLAKDTSTAANASAARNVSFNVGAPVDTTKPLVKENGFTQVGNKVTVEFDREVTAATALNVANYSIDGVSSPFETAIFKGDAKTVELTLKNDVITTNGVRNYTVSNVATSAGSVMDSKTGAYNFKENIRPTVVSAKVISGTQIEVTLSEALAAGTVGTDFDVFQGTSTTALAETGEALSGNNKVVITLASGLESLSGLTLKASSTLDLTDLNGNVVNFVGPIAVN